ncbi:hypothetical protein AB0H28_23225 [Micromonospora sp. NPDC050980]|uniref:hypothetical protein n=1 Tax=Micromonospora sp. NPDC050980 TaxID=3155161 RepID=UPI0033C2FA9E
MALRRDPPPRRTGPELYRRPFGKLALHVGDIDDVLTLLRRRTSDVALRAGRAIADEASDLKEATSEELTNITIVTASPAITVRLGQSAAEVSTAEASSDAAKVIVDDVHALLSERQSFWAGSGPFWAFAGIGIAASFVLIGSDMLSREEQDILLPAIGLIATGVLFGLIVWRDHVKGGIAVVKPARISERRSFLQGAWVVVFSVVASSIVTFFLTYWQISAK